VILSAPLGARSRTARLKGIFSAAKPPKKWNLLYLISFDTWIKDMD
jgi:hypothetical protein